MITDRASCMPALFIADINECFAGSVGNTTCEEVCVNTPGSWHCDCFSGYTILANEISCRGETGVN